MRAIDRTGGACYIFTMAEVEQSLKFQERPEKIWAVLSDLNNWNYLGATSSYRRSFHTTFTILEGSVPGPGMRFGISYNKDPEILQTWEVDEWKPPNKFAASSKSCRAAYNIMTMESSLSFTITPIDTLDTRVDFRFTLTFTNPYLGRFLNTLFPTEWRLRKVLGNVCLRLPKLLSQETSRS